MDDLTTYLQPAGRGGWDESIAVHERRLRAMMGVV